MDITVRGRHTDVNDRFRRHVDTKLAKIERLDRKVMRVDVEVSQERNPRQADQWERVELTIRSKGPVIRAEAAADDRYGALDLALGKLESKLRREHDRRKVHHGNRSPAKLATMEAIPDATADAAPAPQGKARNARSLPAKPAQADSVQADPAQADPAPATAGDKERADEHLVPIPTEGDCPLVVREKFHKADPMGIEQALFEMELVGHDFFLFRDKATGHPSVVYRRRGWDYGVIRLVEE
ncbi:ribosomal subunit interface protein [Actinomadura sp. NBRC 104412]|uniref:ribosome hibernation-promoting factor, HPF/YfiA family n=1 Tax=Actinomadura sp. NBRC 104412 TaxID=3032203 RepID=UPI0024A0682F|nr:ribosome-associated translation inhibitor RaiA [Actinomadura sp. NBRC 104412]GLZ03865.1 ribosomal subunit interface protein [Actinomadura sp. NBRC 104412]